MPLGFCPTSSIQLNLCKVFPSPFALLPFTPEPTLNRIPFPPLKTKLSSSIILAPSTLLPLIVSGLGPHFVGLQAAFDSYHFVFLVKLCSLDFCNTTLGYLIDHLLHWWSQSHLMVRLHIQPLKTGVFKTHSLGCFFFLATLLAYLIPIFSTRVTPKFIGLNQNSYLNSRVVYPTAHLYI